MLDDSIIHLFYKKKKIEINKISKYILWLIDWLTLQEPWYHVSYQKCNSSWYQKQTGKKRNYLLNDFQLKMKLLWFLLIALLLVVVLGRKGGSPRGGFFSRSSSSGSSSRFSSRSSSRSFSSRGAKKAVVAGTTAWAASKVGVPWYDSCFLSKV